MTYIVTENCIKCKYMDCVEVCPVDCFYEGANMLVIHPDECIDCGVCEPECPPEAIKADTESGLEKWLSVNAEYAKSWPNISQKGTPPADAKEMQGVADIVENALLIRFKFTARPGNPAAIQREAVKRMFSTLPGMGIEFAKEGAAVVVQTVSTGDGASTPAPAAEPAKAAS